MPMRMDLKGKMDSKGRGRYWNYPLTRHPAIIHCLLLTMIRRRYHLSHRHHLRMDRNTYLDLQLPIPRNQSLYVRPLHRSRWRVPGSPRTSSHCQSRTLQSPFHCCCCCNRPHSVASTGLLPTHQSSSGAPRHGQHYHKSFPWQYVCDSPCNDPRSRRRRIRTTFLCPCHPHPGSRSFARDHWD